MKTSETIGKISPALLKAQRAITFAVKDAKNRQFKSTYADLSSVIDASKPALNDAGICFIQMAAPSDPGCLALTTRLIHESGEWIESTATCPLQRNDPQGYGSALTYLKRYSLASAVGLYQDDDDGNAATKTVKLVARAPVIPVAKGAMDALAADRRSFLIDTAEYVKERFEANDLIAAHDAVYEVTDDGELMALSTLIPSNIRTAIRKHHETTKEVA